VKDKKTHGRPIEWSHAGGGCFIEMAYWPMYVRLAALMACNGLFS
jgi:hypothetical protein